MKTQVFESCLRKRADTRAYNHMPGVCGSFTGREARAEANICYDPFCFSSPVDFRANSVAKFHRSLTPS